MRTARPHAGWAVALLLLFAGCGAGSPPLVPADTATSAATVAPSARPAPAPPTPPAPRPAPAARRPGGSAPAGLDIPALGVHAGPLLSLGIERDGTLEVPPDARSAGWYRLSPQPGAVGPAVILAHVDYAGVLGVFSRLKDLRPGDEVRVRRADGAEVVFTTYRVDRYPKSAFPTAQVYGNTPGPELRLITCGGVFDHGTGQYRDNVVAYARLAAGR